MNYELMLEYVKNKLTEANALKSPNPLHPFRDRFMHTIRVYNWAKVIHEDLDCNLDVLYTAAIFHDVGYSLGKQNHALSSSIIFEEYAKENGFDKEFTKSVSNIIKLHSDKKLLNDPNSCNELIILQEADLLDEEGALGIIWDLLAIGKKEDLTYYDSIDALKHSGHILEQEYMVTKKAKEIWDKKKELVRQFIEETKKDLFLEDL